MASIAEQPYNMFSHHHEGDEFPRYPDPTQTVFTCGPANLTIPADAFGAFPRSAQDVYPASMGFEPSPFTEASTYLVNNRASPGMYPDDNEMRLSASARSTTNSTISSPESNHGQTGSLHDWQFQPSIVSSDYIAGAEYGFPASAVEELGFEFAQHKAFVDPALINGDIGRPPMGISPYDAQFQQPRHPYPTSPSATSSSPQPNMLRTSSSSPFLHNGAFQPAFSSPYPAPMDPHGRRPSIGGAFISPTSTGDYHSGDENKEKQRCQYPDCGKIFKDLKAHMLTHQNERPEKCPITHCEYHIKGFARKYDKNRHTLTHYKGSMVCGFCPGSGSTSEKFFNRADVFKRHLTSVHGVEQTPPNSRKKATGTINAGKKLTGYAPDATGKCSTCTQTFANAQEFYEHLDDCVLRIVQQEDPSEAVNAKHLAEVENDKAVHQTLEKNNLPTTTQVASIQDDDDDDMADDDVDDMSGTASPGVKRKNTNPAGGVQKSRGLTFSRNGQAMHKIKGRKHRRDYPTSWGFDKGRMTMKKRVMAVFDGPRRLAKDDMMLSTEYEMRFPLSDGKSYVTDLDILTLKRADAFHNATKEEKGPWISDDPTEEEIKEMQEMQEILALSPASI
ncbi:hypothetical protein B0I35DRAFT_482229 [Stachybotrys elegans]|uniref:C2H2-type domain-containing protein n=1 Tax=Stachybotrys elegans TaxID=80388 RepID=A0A8K0WNG9_9HYPO|nr:hypothetical protein B0I35DRAFT_482229 [Stachybotrys elegans]